MEMTLFRKQPSEPSKPPLARNRCRGRRGRTKRGGLGFDYRDAARILNPLLLDKLPGRVQLKLFGHLDEAARISHQRILSDRGAA